MTREEDLRRQEAVIRNTCNLFDYLLLKKDVGVGVQIGLAGLRRKRVKVRQSLLYSVFRTVRNVRQSRRVIQKMANLDAIGPGGITAEVLRYLVCQF